MNNQNAQNRNIVIGSFVLTDLIGSVFTRSKPITVTIIQVLFYASGIGYFTYKVVSALFWVASTTTKGAKTLVGL